jgi:hypothetical protein
VGAVLPQPFSLDVTILACPQDNPQDNSKENPQDCPEDFLLCSDRLVKFPLQMLIQLIQDIGFERRGVALWQRGVTFSAALLSSAIAVSRVGRGWRFGQAARPNGGVVATTRGGRAGGSG